MKNPAPTPLVLSPEELALLGAERFRLLFRPQFSQQYDAADVVAGMKRLESMPQAEFDALQKMKADRTHPVDHVALLWYVTAPSKKEAAGMKGPDGNPVWTRERILDYMDDLSGRRPATLSPADAALTYVGWTGAIALAGWGVDKLVEQVEEWALHQPGLWVPALSTGFLAIAATLKLHDIKEVKEVFEAAKHALAEAKGLFHGKRKEKFLWKLSTPDNPVPVFEVLFPKPKAWQGIQVKNAGLSPDLCLRLSRCPINQVGKALKDPARALAIVDAHERRPLEAKLAPYMAKILTQVSRACETITGLDPAEVRFRQAEADRPSRPATLSAAAQRCLPPAGSAPGESTPSAAPVASPLNRRLR